MPKMYEDFGYIDENYEIKCHPNRYGEFCQFETCSVKCAHGECADHQCKCYNGWTGISCNVPTCLNECSSHGVCRAGNCLCDDGYRGQDCSERFVYHGEVFKDHVVCDKNWYGINCNEKLCEKDCNHNGVCKNGTCYCNDGFFY